MHCLRWTTPALLIALLSSPATAFSPQTAPDNTKVNTRDRAKGAATADQQKDNATDRDLTQRIRKALMADKSLSTYAHNVKVITQGGQVTLKGPVRTDEEVKSVESKAVEVAGAGHVTNQMSVMSSSKKQHATKK
jgi:hyperosmotically inducible protein